MLKKAYEYQRDVVGVGTDPVYSHGLVRLMNGLGRHSGIGVRLAIL